MIELSSRNRSSAVLEIVRCNPDRVLVLEEIARSASFERIQLGSSRFGISTATVMEATENPGPSGLAVLDLLSSLFASTSLTFEATIVAAAPNTSTSDAEMRLRLGPLKVEYT